MRAEGPRIVLDAELKRALSGELGDDAVAPRAAAAWLVHSLATETGGDVQVAEDGGVLLFGATIRG